MEFGEYIIFKKINKSLNRKWKRIKKPFRLFFEFAFSIKKTKQDYKLALKNFPFLSDIKEFNVKRLRNSDTLYILGSGPSINTIDQQQWEIIKQCDSVGFNNWLFHDHIPDFYFFEAPRGKENRENFVNNLNLRLYDYKNVLLFIKDVLNTNRVQHNLDLLSKFENVGSNNNNKLYISPGFQVMQNDQSFIDFLKYNKNLLRKCNSKQISLFIEKRGSLTTLIHFGLSLGYSKIVLAGIDLNNNDYFYLHNKNRYLQKGFVLPEHNPNQKHWIMDQSLVKDMTMDEIVYALNDYLLKPAGIELKVMFNTSALFPRIPSLY